MTGRPDISRVDFRARFTADLVKLAGPKDAHGEDTASYAHQWADSYYDDPYMKDETPEDCAQADFDCWEAA